MQDVASRQRTDRGVSSKLYMILYCNKIECMHAKYCLTRTFSCV